MIDNFLYPLVVDRRLKEVSLFYSRLAGLIQSGIPLYQAVAHLEGQTNSRLLQKFLRESRVQIQAGGSFSEVLAASPQLFSEAQIELVRAGEAGGVLEEALKRAAEYLEWELKVRRYLSRQTVYAKTVFVCIVWILPTLFGLTYGTNMWQAILASLTILLQLLGLGLLGLTLFGIFRTLLQRQPSLGSLYDRVKWRLPGIGGVTRKWDPLESTCRHASLSIL